MIEFTEWPKIARLNRGMVITEKIDGTNASIYIPELPGEAGDKPFLVGSRTRWITPEQDNYGFARWAYERADDLLKLGPGHHFGEWWGSGCQRGYDLPKGEKRFSLFNVGRWTSVHVGYDGTVGNEIAPKSCYVVPILYQGAFDTHTVRDVMERLQRNGSEASPGFMRPEGVVVWHEAARTLFKATLEKDEQPKGKQ